MALFRRRVNQLSRQFRQHQAIQRKFATDYSQTKPLSGRPDLVAANFQKIQRVQRPLQQALTKAREQRQSGLLRTIRQAILAPRLIRRQVRQRKVQARELIQTKSIPFQAAARQTIWKKPVRRQKAA